MIWEVRKGETGSDMKGGSQVTCLLSRGPSSVKPYFEDNNYKVIQTIVVRYKALLSCSFYGHLVVEEMK